MQTIPEDRRAVRTLAARKGFGSIDLCPSGCYHVRLRHLAFRLSGPEYRMFLELLADAAEGPGGTGVDPEGVSAHAPRH